MDVLRHLAQKHDEWPFAHDEMSVMIPEITDNGYEFHQAKVTRAQWQEAREALTKPAKPGAPMPPISEAPKGATHWDPGIKCTPSWAKLDGDQWFWWPVRGAPVAIGWRPYAKQAADSDTFIAIEKPWNGEGLPPVGIDCEHQVFGCEGWTKAAVIAYGAKKTFYRDEHGHEWSRLSDEIKFRPIRTPEQIAAEERESEISEIFRVCGVRAGDGGREVAQKIFDAGYRKVNDGNQKA